MKTQNFFWAMTICLCLTVLGAWADVPHYINFQGTLTDTSGNPITGIRSIQFSIYADSTSIFSIWTETQPSVEVTDGLFSVSLGVITPLSPTLFNGATRWLGIRVAPDVAELSPRQAIRSVPYSFRAIYSDTAQYANIAASDSDWTISGSNIYRTTGNVGIGTASPGYKLQVEGQAISGVNCIAPGQNATVSGGQNNKARGRFSVVAGGGGGTAADSNSAIGYYSAIGGGKGNTASGEGATVSGGGYNKASGLYSVVAGGGSSVEDSNSAIGDKSVIGGGFRNFAGGIAATVSGGQNNTASQGYAAIGGGYANTATYPGSTVGGGMGNLASNNYATISGGYENIASGDDATVSGGRYNNARGFCSVIAGGGGNNRADSNSASGDQSVIGGGRRNTASDELTTVGGGYSNTASGRRATVGGGHTNTASGDGSTIGGGDGGNTASGTGSTVSGGQYNTASGENATVGGGENNQARGSFSVVAGGGYSGAADSNSALGDFSTVGGGIRNIASGHTATVSGGNANTASGIYSTAGGGGNNLASNVYATVSGGGYNRARGYFSVIAGGGGENNADSNSASGDRSVVLGGSRNMASGNYSVAMGQNATASGTNSFAAGKWVTAGTASNSFVLGVGLSLASPLVNNTANSLMVGFGATTPTMFVGGASQYVGVKTSTPRSELHVEGTITVDQKIQADDAGGLELASDEGTTRIKLNDNGNVGIGTTSPGNLLHLYQATGNPALKIESDAGAPQINLDGTDAQGTYALEFKEAGTFKASMGWDSDNDHFFIYQTRNAIAVKNGNVGINNVTPNAQLDVNGTTKLGSSGTIFNEIREITGTLSSTGTQSTFSLPSGYTSTNTRVISIEFSYATNYWMGIGYPITNRQFGYLLWGTSIVIDHQDNGYFNDKPIRILLMKIG